MNKKKKITLFAGTALLTLSASFALAACGGGSEHNVKEIQAKDATCTEAGNILYYACTDDGCGKIFSDAEGKNEVSLQEVIKPALGHDPQKVEAEDATCTTDGHSAYYDCSRCDVNFADAAGTQEISLDEITIEKFDHEGIEEVPAVKPTLESEGNVYHWHCALCGKDFTNRNANKEIEDVTIPKLVKETGLTLNVKTYDAPGTEGTAPTGNFTLTGTEYPDSTTAGVSIAGGKLSVTELVADSYKFEIEGYYPVYFTVEKGTTTYNLELYKHFHNTTVDRNENSVTYDYLDGDLKVHYNNVPFSGAEIPTVHFNDNKVTGSNYMAQFTVKYENLSEWHWTERFAIRLGASSNEHEHIGVMFFVAGTDIRVNEFIASDLQMGEGNDDGRNPQTITGANATAFEAALKGEGLQIRAMRSGNQLAVRVLLNGEWVKLWEKNVAGLTTDFALHASSPNCTCTVSDMKFFDYVEMTQTHFGYFTEGTGENQKLYSSFDAGETTLEDMQIQKQTVTVNVEVYNSLRTKIDVPADLRLTLTDSYDRDTIEDATVTNGVLSATQFLPGKYNISAIDGYYTVEALNVNIDESEYTIKLYQKDSRFTIENNDERVTPAEGENDLQISFNVNFDHYNPVAVTFTDSKITGENYMADLTLQAKNVTAYNWKTRIAIYTGTSNTNGTRVGFVLMLTSADGVQVAAAELGNTSLNPFDGKDIYEPEDGKKVNATAFMTALKGNGVKIRVSRNGNMHYIRAYLNNEWVLLYQARMDGLGAGLQVLATTNDTDGIAVSQVSYADSFVAQTNEKYAHFIKDGKYYTVDGKETTLDGLDVVKLENLTINVKVYDKEGDDKQEATAPATAFSVYGDRAAATESNVTIEDGKLSVTALYPGKYIIMLDGYLPVTFTVEDGTTVYNLELYPNDRQGNVSIDQTTGDITYNNPWNGGVVTTLKDDITGENYMVEFTLKYQFDEGKNWGWTERFSIILGMSPVDEKPIGFMFFMAGDNEIVGANAVSNDIRWFGQGHEEIRPFAKDSADVAAINTALKGDGLKVRGVRNGNQLTVYFLIGTEWKVAWTKTVEGLSSYIGVTAAHNNSTLTVSGITYGEYVAATDTKQAHLTDGTNVYTLDGVQTTDEALAIGQE